MKIQTILYCTLLVLQSFYIPQAISYTASENPASLPVMAMFGIGNEVLNSALQQNQQVSLAIAGAEYQKALLNPVAKKKSEVFPDCDVIPPLDTTSTIPVECKPGPMQSVAMSIRYKKIAGEMDALTKAIDVQTKDTCFQDSQNKKMKEIDQLTNGVKTKIDSLMANIAKEKRKADEKKIALIQGQKMLKGGGNPQVVEKLMSMVPNQCKNVIDESKIKEMATSTGITGMDKLGIDEKTRINNTYNKVSIEATLDNERKKIKEYFTSGVEVNDFQSQIAFIKETARIKTAQVQQKYDNILKAMGPDKDGYPEKVEDLVRDSWSVERNTVSADGWKNKAVLDCISNSQMDPNGLDFYIKNLKMDPKADPKRKADFQTALEQIVNNRNIYTADDMLKMIKNLEQQSGISAYFEGNQVQGGQLSSFSDKFKSMQDQCNNKVANLKSNPYANNSQSQAQIQNQANSKMDDIKKSLASLPNEIMTEIETRLYDKGNFTPTPSTCEEAYKPDSLKFNFAKADVCQDLMKACSTSLNQSKNDLVQKQDKDVKDYDATILSTFNTTQEVFKKTFSGISDQLKAATSIYKLATFKDLPNMSLTSPMPINLDTPLESEQNLDQMKNQIQELSNNALSQIDKLKQDVKTETDQAIQKMNANLQKDRAMATQISSTCDQKYTQDQTMMDQMKKQQMQSQQASMQQALNACVQQMNFNSADPGCLGTMGQLNQMGATFFSNSASYPGMGYALGAGAISTFPQDRRRDCFASQPQSAQPVDDALSKILLSPDIPPDPFKLCAQKQTDEGIMQSIETSMTGPLYSAYQTLRLQQKLNPDQIPLFDAMNVSDPMRAIKDLVKNATVTSAAGAADVKIGLNGIDITETLKRTNAGSFLADYIYTTKSLSKGNSFCSTINKAKSDFIGSLDGKKALSECQDRYRSITMPGADSGSEGTSFSSNAIMQRNCENEVSNVYFDSNDYPYQEKRDEVKKFMDYTIRMLQKQAYVASEAQNYAFSNAQNNWGQESSYCKAVKIYNALTPVLPQGSYSQSPGMMPGGAATGGFGAPGMGGGGMPPMAPAPSMPMVPPVR